MSEAIAEKKLNSKTRENVEAYFNSHDVKFITEDAVFINMNTGEKTVGKQAIGDMLHFMYHIAFDAKAEIINTIITEDHAVLEARFKGKHIGEVNGVKPTHNNMDVPLCVVYDLKDNLIKTARIYMLESVMQQQMKAL